MFLTRDLHPSTGKAVFIVILKLLHIFHYIIMSHFSQRNLQRRSNFDPISSHFRRHHRTVPTRSTKLGLCPSKMGSFASKDRHTTIHVTQIQETRLEVISSGSLMNGWSVKIKSWANLLFSSEVIVKSYSHDGDKLSQY